MILIFLYVPLVVLKFFTSGCLYAIAVPAFFLVVGGLIIFTLLILVKRDKIIEEILKNKHDEIIRNKKNIEIGKDLLAPLGVLVGVITKILNDVAGWLLLDSNYAELGALATWLSLAMFISTMIIPNYVYYSHMHYMIGNEPSDVKSNNPNQKDGDYEKETFIVSVSPAKENKVGIE